MGLSTHILDVSNGRPAAGVSLALARMVEGEWRDISRDVTDADGRCRTLLANRPLAAETYRLRFMTAEYFAAENVEGLYPWVDIVFTVTDADQHHHIPLLLAPHGYSTYRGS